MRIRISIIILTSFMTFILTGCNGARETDEVAWVTTVGIDKASDGEMLLTFRVAIPQSLASAGSGENGGKAQQTSALYTIKAVSLGEGRNLLNVVLSRAVNFTHVTAIVIGEELGKQGLQGLVAQLMRYREFRGSIFIFLARGSAKELMEVNKPKLEILTARWVENIVNTYDESSYYLPTTLNELYIKLKASTGSPYIVTYGVNPMNLADQGDIPGLNSRAKSYLPGNIPRTGGNAVDFAGMAVFKEDKLAGYLTTQETISLSILFDKFTRGYLVAADPLTPECLISVALHNSSKPSIVVDIDGDHPVIHIDAFLAGEITAVPSGIRYEAEEYTVTLEKEVSTIVRQQMLDMLLRTQSWGADVVDFGYYIRPKFSTLEQLNQYHWDRRFRQAKFDVQITTKLRRTGLLNRTNAIRREAAEP